jgi:ABC-type taurine transport system ATPase subunit
MTTAAQLTYTDSTQILDGDVIDLGVSGGKTLIARVNAGRVRMEHGGIQTADMALDQMSAAQIAGILRAKVRQITERPYTTGRVTC